MFGFVDVRPIGPQPLRGEIASCRCSRLWRLKCVKDYAYTYLCMFLVFLHCSGAYIALTLYPFCPQPTITLSSKQFLIYLSYSGSLGRPSQVVYTCRMATLWDTLHNILAVWRLFGTPFANGILCCSGSLGRSSHLKYFTLLTSPL